MLLYFAVILDVYVLPSITTDTVLAPALTFTGTTCIADEILTVVFLAPVTETVADLPAAPATATETTKSLPDFATDVEIPR